MLIMQQLYSNYTRDIIDFATSFRRVFNVNDMAPLLLDTANELSRFWSGSDLTGCVLTTGDSRAHPLHVTHSLNCHNNPPGTPRQNLCSYNSSLKLILCYHRFIFNYFIYSETFLASVSEFSSCGQRRLLCP